MYLCTACKKMSIPGQARLVHVVKRLNGQIAAELSVCVGCKELLGMGVTYQQLCRQHGRLQEVRRPRPEPIVTGRAQPTPPAFVPIFGAAR